MKVFYKNLEFEILKDVYKPAEDTFLLADNLDIESGEYVLELGTGSGLLSIISAKKGANVIATDVNTLAIECAKKNAERHEVNGNIEFRIGNMFDPISDEVFDLILFNPPYLPVSKEESSGDVIERAWDGGLDGRKFIDEFLSGVGEYLKPGGRFYFIQSSLSDVQKTLSELRRNNWEFIKKSEKFFFEKIYLFKVFIGVNNLEGTLK